LDIGILGTGRIARRLVPALVNASPDHRIRITRRSEPVSGELIGRFPDSVTRSDDAQAIVDASATVFLCLPGEGALETLGRLQFRGDQAVISTMMGVARAEIARAVAPATDVSVTIPLPFVEDGNCPLPVHPESRALRELLGHANPVIPVADEAGMSGFWAVAGSLASVIGELATIRDWLTTRLGDRAAAERYVLALFGGYLHTRPLDGADRLGEALEDLGTPGGLNAGMLQATRDSGHYDRVRAELDRLNAWLRGESTTTDS
jgi:pyrroline-5-carboxylate reductase